MHVVQAGISHVCPLATLAVAGQDPAVSSSVLTKSRTEQDLRLCVEGGLEANAITLSEESSLLRCDAQFPSISEFIALVHAHRKSKDPFLAGRLYLKLCEYGVDVDEDLGNHLVPMLATCGHFHAAQQLFEKIPFQGEHAWTSLLHGYVEYGDAHLAFPAFQKMQNSRLHPTVHTFVALIKACEDLRDIEKGRELHAEVVNRGCEGEPFVTNSLLCMYAKCGSILEAENVFDQIHPQDTVAWTALMAAYVDCDLGEEALACHTEMQAQGLQPDLVTFVCTLKACASAGAIDRGQIVHKEIIEEGFDTMASVGNTLIDMYAKCKLFEEARQLFDELTCKDIVSWTALITGYAEHGLGQNAVMLLEQMQFDGIILDQKMYISALKACCSINFERKGLELHNEIAVDGFDVEINIANTLIDMYSKFGLLDEAKCVFDELSLPDVVSWTTLIAGLAEYNHRDEVELWLQEMELKGCSPNVPTYVCTLKACCQSDALNWGYKMHGKFVAKGFDHDMLLAGALVDMYAKCGSLNEAQAILTCLSTPNIVSWSALIAGYAEQGDSNMAIECLQQIEDAGLSASLVALVSSLKACSNASDLQSGYKVHNVILKKGLETVQTCSNALVDMYAKCGLLEDAQDTFEKMQSHDVIGWTALMAGYADHGFNDEALICFVEMQSEGVFPDIMLWNTAILCHEGDIEESMLLYARMQEQCILPNSFSSVSCLQGCSKTAALEMGRKIHVRIEAAEKCLATEELLSTALVDMYGKCGSTCEALEVFHKLPNRNLFQWNAMITAYARQVECESVFLTFEKMTEEGVIPDRRTFDSILFTCCHGGLLKEGQMYYESMVKNYGATPEKGHDSCMVDLLGRVGCMNESVLMLQMLPYQEDSVAWNAILGSCQKLGDMELSEQAFHTVIDLGKEDSKSFIMMANIYADVGF